MTSPALPRRPADPPPCDCGRARAYTACCGLFHADPMVAAPDPESLMRSRYSAFVRDERAYLLATWHPSTRPAEIEAPEPGLRWLGLEVKDVRWDGGDEGTVRFVARYKLGGRAFRLEETSRFVREAGRWTYVAALDAA